MEEVKEALTTLGLSKIESEVYLAILSNPQLSAGKISKITNNYRPNVYQAIERLKTKGFIYETQGKKSKLFEAFSPDQIFSDFKKKQETIEKTIPLLNSLKAIPINIAQMRIIEGTKGWKNLLDEFLQTGRERVVFGVPKRAVDLLEGFFKDYHKERAKRKIKIRHIFNYDARNRIKITNKLPFTESKYLESDFDQPVSTSVCGNIVAITLYEKNTILTFVIENETIANAYRKYFEFLWKKAKA